jgi:hypothetical protein
MRSLVLALLLAVSPSLLLAAQGPAPASNSGPSTSVADQDTKGVPTDTTTAADPGKVDSRKAIGVPPAVKARRQAQKNAMARGAAKGRAEFQAALQQQEQARQNAILQQKQATQQQQLQQWQNQQMIQRMMPQGQTVVTVNPDGTYQTKTYYVYPSPLLPGMNNQPVTPPVIVPTP